MSLPIDHSRTFYLILSFVAGAALFIFLNAVFVGGVLAMPTATITLEVDTTLDSNDAAYQACTAVPDDCSLRGAISKANADIGNDYVVNLPAGTFTFTLAGSKEDNNVNGDLDVKSHIALNGIDAAATIINANQLDRAFHIHPGYTLTINQVQTINGKAPDGTVGNTGQIGGTGASGGGIYNSGTLTLTHTILNGNSAGSGGDGGDGGFIIKPICSPIPDGGPGGAGGSGGGIYNAGILVIEKSALSGNSSGSGGEGGIGGDCQSTPIYDGDAGPGGDAGHGGGIYNTSGSILSITNSLLSNNLTGEGGYYPDLNPLSDGAGDGGSGGGIYNAGTVTIMNSTLSGNITGNGGNGYDSGAPVKGPAGSGGHGGGLFNNATLVLENVTLTTNQTGSVGFGNPGATDGLGGGIYATSGASVYRSTIIAGNDSPVDSNDDCSGTLTSQGYNLVGDSAGCPTNGLGDQATLDAQLGSLADNGGDTHTHDLLASSPAIDQIPDGSAGCAANVSSDQRGAVRAGGIDRGGSLCDVGAYEFASVETPTAVRLQMFSAGADAFSVEIVLIGFSQLALIIWIVQKRRTR